MRPFHEFVTFETKKNLLKAGGKRTIEVYFPLYGGVSEIEIADALYRAIQGFFN